MLYKAVDSEFIEPGTNVEINGANPASEFAGLIGDGNYVYAWDGSVMVGYKWAWYTNLFNLGWGHTYLIRKHILEC